MKKVIFIGYIILLSVLALISVITTWSNDSYSTLIVEIFVDFTLVIGCVVYLLQKKVKFWWVVVLFTMVGEARLLWGDSGSDSLIVLFWAAILTPAVYFNIKIDKKFGGVLK